MKLLFTFICSAIISVVSFGQNINYAYFELTQDSKNVQTIVLEIDDLIFNIYQNGTDFTFNQKRPQFKRDDYYDYFDPELDYISRNNSVEYYTNTFDEYLKNRIKRINNLNITYIDRFSMYNNGKIKNIGSISFEYYDRFDWSELEGKIKKIGPYKITYYDRFDRKELEGKVKSIGDVTLEYYTVFDNKGIPGKLKRTKGNTKTMHVMPAPLYIPY